MKALVRFNHKQKKIKIIDIEKPFLDKNCNTHAIIKISYSGICGRDIEHYNSKLDKKKIPYVMGHEFSGIILEINKNKKNLKKNDRVVCETVVSVCERCSSCLSGYYNLCPKRKNIGSGNTGSFAKYIKVPVKYIHKITNKISLKEAALIEPMAVCYNALIKNTEIKKNENLIIFGSGTIGLICLKIAKMRGSNVTLITTRNDVIQSKIAKSDGVEKIFYYDKDKLYMREILQFYNNRNVDCVIDTVGGSDETISAALELVRPGGKIVKLGWFMKKNINANLDLLIRKNINLIGSFSHNNKIWENCITILDKKKISLNNLITKVDNLPNWKKYFAILQKRKAVKVLLTP